MNTRTALVTGASRGIGQAIAGKFAAAGYQVLTPARAELDLTSASSVEAFVRNHGAESFDVIINNAGVNEIHLLEEVTDAELEHLLAVNLTSPIRLLRGLLPGMRRRGGGRIVNIASIWAVVGRPGRSLYAATKHALHGITNVLALEAAADGILVNTVCPGFTLTELTLRTNDPATLRTLAAQIPLRRMAEPAEIAEVVHFLGSERNTYLTGQKITVDGGYCIQ
jgi:3-oxoacyl-[acyl-carrier protein] reductase